MTAGSAHLQAYEVEMKDCLSKREDETCFPLKTTPGLAVDYQNRRVRVENLSRKEGERFLNFFADQAGALKIDKEEAWGYFEGTNGGQPVALWVEIGDREEKDAVYVDLTAVIDVQFQLEDLGWMVGAVSVYHIHQAGDSRPDIIHSFNYGDLDSVTNLLPVASERFAMVVDERVVTPAGIYVLKPKEQKWESRGGYFRRFVDGVKHFMDEEDGMRRRAFSPGRDWVEASQHFALLANTNLAAHASPVVVSFIPAQDQ